MSAADLRRVLVDLRVAFDDADAVTVDMLRPLRHRELGPALHRANYREAKEKLLHAHAAAMRLLSDDGDDGPTDPAGNGGSPAH